MKRTFLIAAAALVCWTPLSTAYAQAAYPADRPITLIVPFAAGGGTDILARLVAEKLGEDVRQTVVVDNKPGANGIIAIRALERAKPDGHTLMFGSSSTHVLAPLMAEDKALMETVRKQTALVGMVADTPLVLAVNSTSEAGSLELFLQAARRQSLTYGTYGSGSSPHVLGALLAAETKAKLTHVAYKGSSPAITDLRGGHIDSVFLTVAAVSVQVEAKEMRPLAVTGPRRVQTLPDVPTFKEAGVAGLEDSGWFAVFAPAGTPSPALDKLHASIAKAMALPAMQGKLVELGLQYVPVSRVQGQLNWDRSIASTRKMLKNVKIGAQ